MKWSIWTKQWDLRQEFYQQDLEDTPQSRWCEDVNLQGGGCTRKHLHVVSSCWWSGRNAASSSIPATKERSNGVSETSLEWKVQILVLSLAWGFHWLYKSTSLRTYPVVKPPVFWLQQLHYFSPCLQDKQCSITPCTNGSDTNTLITPRIRLL